jgi:hypothetical protein
MCVVGVVLPGYGFEASVYIFGAECAACVCCCYVGLCVYQLVLVYRDDDNEIAFNIFLFF